MNKATTKRRSLVGGILTVALLTLAACGTTPSATPTTPAPAATPAPVDTTKYELQYATFVGAENPTSKAFVWWGNEVNKRTNGRVTVKHFYSQALLAGGETIKGVAAGRADLGHVGSAFYPDLSLSMVVGVPFVTTNADAQARAFYDLYQKNTAFRDEYSSRGLHVLVFPPNTPNIIGLQQPIKSTADLVGKKVRASGFISEALAAIKANPVALPSTQIYESMERKVIDAYSGFTFEYVTDFQLQKVAPHIVDSGLGNYVISPIVISKTLWDKLPQDIQKTMTEVSVQYMDEAAKLLAQQEETVCTAVLAAGGSVKALPDADVAAWRTAVGTTIYDKWAANVKGTDAKAFYDQYLSILKEKEGSTKFVPGLKACMAKSK